VTLARRDLFDARFQLISEGAGDGAGNQEDGVNDRTQALEFLDAPSDLVPGVYEGGLKTWECSLDLVDYLEGTDGGDVRGMRVLEVGLSLLMCSNEYFIDNILDNADWVRYSCPKLIPSPKDFSSPPASSDNKQETHIHVQDYNASVLELVTLPNMILAWCTSVFSKLPCPVLLMTIFADMSAASATYRNSLPQMRSILRQTRQPPQTSNFPIFKIRFPSFSDRILRSPSLLLWIMGGLRSTSDGRAV